MLLTDIHFLTDFYLRVELLTFITTYFLLCYIGLSSNYKILNILQKIFTNLECFVEFVHFSGSKLCGRNYISASAFLSEVFVLIKFLQIFD